MEEEPPCNSRNEGSNEGPTITGVNSPIPEAEKYPPTPLNTPNEGLAQIPRHVK